MNSQSKKPYKTGLVLSGGGARGFAHVGVIKALNEAGIYPDVISGSSAGAIIGAMYCDGMAAEDILFIGKKFRIFNIMPIAMPYNGLFKMRGITTLLREKLKARTFEELNTKLYVSATDFYNAKLKVFEEGDLIRPVLASASVPILFKPVMIDKVAYVDSGLMDNLPVGPLVSQCEKIIGVNANPVGSIRSTGRITDIIDRTVRISYRQNILHNKNQCDLYIEPQRLTGFNLLDTSKVMEIAEIGYEYTRRLLELKGKF